MDNYMRLALLTLLGAMAFAQSEPASLAGVVLNSAGAPLSKTTVTLSPTAGPETGTRSIITGSTGEFVFAGIESGTYTISAEHVGYLRGHYGATSGSPVILTVNSGQSLKDLSLRLIQQAVVTGTVVDDDGDPVRHAQVRLLRQGFVRGRRQLTPAGLTSIDDIGQFRIAGIAPGQYYLGAEPPAWQPARRVADKPEDETPVFTWFPHSADRQSAVPVEVRPGQTLAMMDIRMAKSRTFHVRGTVAGAAGRVRVTLAPASGMQGPAGLSAMTAADDSWDIAAVPPGEWIASVAENAGRRAIELVNQDLAGIVLNAETVPPLPGTIRMDPAEALTRPLRILLSGDDGIGFPGLQVEAMGDFTLAGLSTGRYRISVSGIPSGWYLKSATLRGRDVLNSGLEVDDNFGDYSGADRFEITVSRKAAEINGGVLGADGKAAPGAIITLTPDPPQPDRVHLYLRTNADQNGIFRLSGISPGAYRVTAWAELEAGEEFDPELLTTHLPDSLRVTLAEDEKQVMTLVSVPAR